MDKPKQHARRADILNFPQHVALPAPRKPGGLFLLRAPCPQKIKPASKKNPYRLQGRSGATSYLQGSTRVRPPVGVYRLPVFE